MSNQRPAWHRLSSLVMRPPVPAPVPIRPPPPMSGPVPARPPSQPGIPARPSQPQGPTHESGPTPLPPPPPVSLPSATPPSPPPPPRAPLTTPAQPNPAPTTPTPPPRPSQMATPSRPNPVATPAALPQSSLVGTPAPSPRPPVPPPGTMTPPRSLVQPPPGAAAAPMSPIAELPVSVTPPRSPVAPRPAVPVAPQRTAIAPLSPHLSPSLIGAPAPIKSPTKSTNLPLLSKTTLTTSSPSNSQQSSPKTKRQTPFSCSKQSYPVATPTPSPKTLAPSSEYSQKIKPLSHPPSPLTLPPPQIKIDEPEPDIEQKNVLVQETIDKGMKNHHDYTSQGKKEPITTKEHNGPSKKLPDSKEFGMTVITLAGENKGAIMELIHSHKRNNGKHEIAKFVSSNNGYQSKNENGEEGKSKNKDQYTMTTMPINALCNSNVQGVNNSIIYNTNYRLEDPGVHLSLTKKPNGDHKHHG